MQVFDTVAGKVVGSIVNSDEHYIILSNPGLLEFQNVPGETGKTIRTVAVIRGWLPFTPAYALARAGLRGKAVVHEEWLVKLYDIHVTKVQAGAFKLNPFEKTAVELVPGEGHTELTGVTVAEVTPVPVQTDTTTSSPVAEPVTTPSEGANG